MPQTIHDRFTEFKELGKPGKEIVTDLRTEGFSTVSIHLEAEQQGYLVYFDTTDDDKNRLYISDNPTANHSGDPTSLPYVEWEKNPPYPPLMSVQTKLWLAIIACVMVGGFVWKVCGPSSPLHDERINDVTRVLMHETNYYTLEYQVPMSTQILEKSFYFSSATSEERIKRFADVPPGGKMWAVAKGCRSDYDSAQDRCQSLEIHLHSGQDINGAGWDHGKFGHGETIAF